MKKKLILPILIIMAILTLTGGAYAYWAASATGTSSNANTEAEIGTGGVVTTTLDVSKINGTGKLVPVGKENPGTSVSSIQPKFNFTWNGVGAEGTKGSLKAQLVSVKAGTDDVTSLFTLKGWTNKEIIIGTPLNNVSATIEFTSEPANATEYAKIAGKKITITLKFEVTI
ncbi:hypothetical protein BN85412970 [Alteracholeplasma palmae J233]|uniref:SipW-cognate class signal peptide n=1 Tax=Alteracholeplasma palmae (strain ATCC 49389 / J233) TaxID=1318466 RepID=U4KLM5_ALTPJ|nr:hypothetical protein [Alteracholeplasma palmae]CCV64874.1 hypothetical protein BN85412970 [Alteracholeplasma palmae J233]